MSNDFIDLEGDGGMTAEDLMSSLDMLNSDKLAAIRASLIDTGNIDAWANFLRVNKPDSVEHAALLLLVATQYALDVLVMAAALLVDDDKVDEMSAGVLDFFGANFSKEVKHNKVIADAIITAIAGHKLTIDGDGGTILQPAVDTDQN